MTDRPSAARSQPHKKNALGADFFDDGVGPLVRSISNALAREIIEGKLTPESDLNSVDLSKRFETSRTPIREALLHLAREGLVDVETGKRPRVSSFSAVTIKQINEVRAPMLKLAVEMIARDRKPEALEALKEHAANMQSALMSDDRDFLANALLVGLDLMIELSGNAILIELMRSIRARTHRLIWFARRLGVPDLEERAMDGVRLIKAIHDGDGALAGALMEAMIMKTSHWFEGSPLQND